MPEILKDVIGLIGAAYLLYRFYHVAASTAKIFTNRNKSELKEILSE